MHIKRIIDLLDEASILADEAATEETHATEPFTFLAQLIDSALARAEELRDGGTE